MSMYATFLGSIRGGGTGCMDHIGDLNQKIGGGHSQTKRKCQWTSTLIQFRCMYLKSSKKI